MIGIGWATLYASIIENYERESKFKINLQPQQPQSCNNSNLKSIVN